MRLVFNCPKCRKEYEVDDKLAGRKSRCGVCGQTFRIPTSTPDHSNPTAKASSESWDEPVPFFEVVEDEPPRSFKSAAPVASQEPVYFEDDLPPPPRVAPVDFSKKKSPSRRDESESAVWEQYLRIYLTFSVVSFGIILFMALTGLINVVGVGMIGWALVIGLMIASLVALLAGALGLLVLTAKESFVCLLLSLFVPFYSLYYLITRWSRVRGAWGMGFSAYLVIIAMSLLIPYMNHQRHVAMGGTQVAAQGRPGAPLPPPPGAPGPAVVPSTARTRVITLILHGLPPDRDQGLGPRESDVTAAVRERLKSLVPNCGAMSTTSSNGNVRITVVGSTTPESLAAAIDFGRARANGDEIDVQISPDFVESAPIRGQQRVAAAEPRRAMPPPPQPMIAANPGQAPGNASFPGDDPVAKSLVEITQGDPHRRKQAVERLGRIVPDQRVGEVVRTLIPLLTDDDGFLASETIKTLAIWKSPDSVTALIQRLDDNRFFVRKEAIKALGKIGDPRAVEPMMTHWKEDGHDVEESLKSMGPVAEPGVLARIADGDPNTRRRICEILALIGGQATLRTMQRMRPDPDLGVQVASKNAWRAIIARVGPPPLKKK